MVDVVDAAFCVPSFFPPGRQGDQGIGFMPAGFLRPVVDVESLACIRVHHLFPFVVAAHGCGCLCLCRGGALERVGNERALHLTWAGKPRGGGGTAAMSEVINGQPLATHLWIAPA